MRKIEYDINRYEHSINDIVDTLQFVIVFTADQHQYNNSNVVRNGLEC